VFVHPEVSLEAVFQRVEMDVMDDDLERIDSPDFFPSKPFLEQASRAAISAVHGFCVTVEKMRELAARVAWSGPVRFPRGNGRDLTGLMQFHTNQEMKMVSKQTIRKRVCNWRDVLSVKTEKILVVSFFYKQILAIVSTVVDMIEGARNEFF
jgi:hypothetical protein